MNNKISIAQPKNKIILTFNINSLPVVLIKLILDYYFDHHVNLYTNIMKKKEQTPSYKIRNRLLSLAVVCKLWTFKVIPLLNNSFYLIDSKGKLESYLKAARYGLLFPSKYLPDNLKMMKRPSNIEERPFQISILEIRIDRSQIPHTKDSVVPAPIYQIITEHSKCLRKLTFRTQQQFNDLYYLLKCLNQSTSITELDISHNSFTLNSYYALCQLITGNNNIQSLVISKCVLSHNESIPLLMSTSDMDDITKCLNHKLVKITEPVTISLVESLAKSKSLTSLTSVNSDILHSVLEIDEGQSPDKRLYSMVPRTNYQLDILKFAKDSPILQKLNIQYNQIEMVDNKDGIFEILETENPNTQNQYEHLHLTINTADTIFYRILRKLLQSHQKLKLLDLSNSTFTNIDALEVLGQRITENQMIKTLDLSNLNIPALEDANNNLGDHDGNAFHQNLTHRFQFLNGNNTLTNLNLSGLGISGTESQSLFQSLSTMTQLRAINLSSNNISGLAAVKDLISFIVKSEHLDTLHLAHNHLGQHMGLLLSSFQLSHSLTDIDISFNSIPDQIGRNLGEFLSYPTCKVRTLIIGNNNFGISTPHHLGSHLQRNKTLVTLGLSGCNFDGIGVSDIIDGLFSHPTISLIDFTNLPAATKPFLSSLVQTSNLKVDVIY
ncbi:leucine-rich repeat-containing protein (LRR) [Tieghemostelium lacteum]|uniref:Leucine-rich repeat-containing protein (LRR) n=1 Tax=Tieghemostelium lacteum TaxID=361077 RepID=A0A152A9E5_TIELA|nr:leucine-rich repeat-containing protein (LRR) [Tieghemostelium lacteum]|eukprot:KYR02687.1 leucine-rich repeat-containing protein (LRR) [Tieghemostelium lacteum]